MGKTISEAQRKRILACPQVQEVTSRHIVLRNDVVVDPDKYVVERRPARFIFSLRRCKCLFRSHRRHTHHLVHGTIDVYADGREQNNYVEPKDICRGVWALEEVLTATRVTPAVTVDNCRAGSPAQKQRSSASRGAKPNNPVVSVK